MRKKVAAKPATMSDIARLAGVSASTVSRALAGSPLVAKKKRELIARLSREHGYVVNVMARNLRLQRTQTIAVTVPMDPESPGSFADPSFLEMFGHLADEITKRGYAVLLQKIQTPSETWLQQLMVGGRSDGIIVIGRTRNPALLNHVADNPLPVIIWDGKVGQQDLARAAQGLVDQLIGRESA